MLLALAVLAALITLFYLSGKIPQVPDSLDKLVSAPPTVIYDSEGRILHTLSGRDMITLDRISPHFLKAIISVEDKNFYRHRGIDKTAVFRSIFINPVRGRTIGAGASTITQQLTKNLFFSFKKDVSRKLKEMLAAVQIEASFSKEEILEAYCNQISFGSSAYGVERASRTFFGKPALDLTLAQAALLAGLPNSPSRLNPYTHPDRARARQRFILKLMERNGAITPEERVEAEAESLTYNQPKFLGRGRWFADRVIEECEKRFGRDAVYFGGLKIFTTLNPYLQEAAVKAVEAHLKTLRETTGSDEVQTALIAISPLSGAVKAHIGGADYNTSQFDRAFNAHRRPGSGFKPFLYYTSMQRLGYTPATLVLDSLVTIKVPGSKDWRVNNFDHQYQGPVILKLALSRSLNTVAARIVNTVGAENVTETAHKFGVLSPLKNNPAIALGTSGVPPLEMASAYSVIATGGEYYEPYIIERVESPRGEVLYEHFISGKRVADPQLIYLLLDMMKEVVDGGTAQLARWSGFRLPAAGKTGTTDDYCDSWFTGFTPTMCASVWVGYDLEKPLRNENGRGITGAQGGLPIWIDFMKTATEGAPPRDFSIPAGIKFISVNPFTGNPEDSEIALTVALPEWAKLPHTPAELSGRNGNP